MSNASMPPIIIDPKGSLIIKVVEKVPAVRDDIKKCYIPQPDKVYEMQVDCEIFANSSATFEGFLSRSKKTHYGIVKLYGTIAGVELWMKALHNTLCPTEKLDMLVSEVLDVVVFGRKFELPIEDLQPWFSSWYETEKEIMESTIKEKLSELKLKRDHLKNVYNIDWLCDLLVLCYQFDHGQGFTFASMHLAYDNPGHLELSSQYEHLLPHRIVHQINAVRSTMSNMIDRTMFYPVCFFQFLECRCKEAATFAYIGALRHAKVFNGKSVFDMMDALDFNGRSLFRYLNHKINKGNSEPRSVHCQAINLGDFEYKAPPNACPDCEDAATNSDIKCLQSFIMEEFNGLCLDCITDDGAQSQGQRNEFGRDCRAPHDRTTWYFSYLGRPDKRDPYKEAYWKRTQKNGNVNTEKTWEMEDPAESLSKTLEHVDISNDGFGWGESTSSW